MMIGEWSWANDLNVLKINRLVAIKPSNHRINIRWGYDLGEVKFRCGFYKSDNATDKKRIEGRGYIKGLNEKIWYRGCMRQCRGHMTQSQNRLKNSISENIEGSMK